MSKGCETCYYESFDEKAYPCSLCIRGIKRTDKWMPSKKTKVEIQTDEEYINNLPWTEVGSGEQTDDAYFLKLMGAVERGEISDAGANQAWLEYINHKDEPQTEENDIPEYAPWRDAFDSMDCCSMEVQDDNGNDID